MGNEVFTTHEYHDWLVDIKQRVRSAQLKAATAVNIALLEFYWILGAYIAEKQKTTAWGSGFPKQLSKDLMVEFPDMKGFSYRNLRAIKQWYHFYSQDNTIWQQAVAKMGQLAVTEKWQQPVAILARIPWGHNLAIISKCDSVEQAFFYVQKTVEHNWSRSVLIHQIESDLFSRSGKAITNFEKTLPATQSDLAREMIKDPYNFDFLTLTEDFTERELEKGFINHVRVVAEYALSDIHKPMGVSEYELTRSLPDELRSSLPTIEQIEAELELGDRNDE